MKTKDEVFISEVWCGYNGRWAFQRVGVYWNLYDYNGDFVREFRSFRKMTLFMEREDGRAGI